MSDNIDTRMTNAERRERQAFRRNDPIWQLIDAVSVWGSWAYGESITKAAEERVERAWLVVGEREQALRGMLEATE